MIEPPKTIYLQFYGDGDPSDEGEVDVNYVTWCEDNQFNYDVRYIRADFQETSIDGMLKALSSHMCQVANAMVEYDDNELMKLYALELQGYAKIAREWAEHIADLGIS